MREWSSSGRLRRAGVTAVLLAVLWWILNREQNESWGVGIPFILLSAIISGWLYQGRPVRIHVGSLVRFLLFFAGTAFKAGLDVARRPWHRRMRLHPGLKTYRFRMPEGPARTVLLNVVSLMPGTLSVDFDRATYTLHVLDMTRVGTEEIRLLEDRVAALFGHQLAEATEGADDE